MRHYQKESPVLLISIPESNTTKNANTLKYNLAFAAFVVNLVIKLIEEETTTGEKITLLTPYNAQYWIYNNVMLRLHLDRPTLSVNEIILAKSDSFQGRERFIVINDLTIKDNPGFVKSAPRVNTALSRARNGKYIITDTAALERNPKNKIRFPTKFITYTKRERIYYVLKDKSTFPHVVKEEAYDRIAGIMKDNAGVTDSAAQPTADAGVTDITWGTADAGAIVEVTTGDIRTTDTSARPIDDAEVATNNEETGWKAYEDDGNG